MNSVREYRAMNLKMLNEVTRAHLPSLGGGWRVEGGGWRVEVGGWRGARQQWV